MEPLFKEYQSTARNVQRGAWFFDFVEYILKEYVERKDLSVVQVIKNSYNDNIYRYHNWFIRRLANLAINLAVSRECFDRSMCEDQCIVQGREYKVDELYQDLEEMTAYVTIVTQHIWDFFKRHGLENLP